MAPSATVTRRERAFDDLLHWLHVNKLTVEAGVLDEAQPADGLLHAVPELVGVSTTATRIEVRPPERIKALRQEWANRTSPATDPKQRAAIWQELRNLNQTIRRIDPARVPSDAIAFYRGFHIAPSNQWGIYIVVPRLLEYLKQLGVAYRPLASLDHSLLASLVLFDVFHHEFFHHLVECTATSLEVLWPRTDGRPVPVYFCYRTGALRKAFSEHPHDPLEEALANAYSYNSFSFAARVQSGYVGAWAGLYQRALEKSWPKEPPGYCEAGAYIKGQQLDGAELLLERMVRSVGAVVDGPLAMVAQAVFPRGHSAYWPKPEIPTYLIGSPEEVKEFNALIPAPNEAYCGLFWPGSTKEIDTYLKEQREKEREAKRAAKQRKAELDAKRKQGDLFT
jgi:hypothetical protein